MTEAITTQRLTLRPIRDADVPAVVAGLGDFEVSKCLASVPHPFTAADVKLRNQDGTSPWPDYAVIDLGGVAIGGVRRRPRLGFWLARDHWGHGYMTEAVAAAIAAEFEHGELSELGACVFEGNGASARVLEKLGFEKVSTCATGSMSVARGQALPQTEYILTRSRWDRLR